MLMFVVRRWRASHGASVAGIVMFILLVAAPGVASAQEQTTIEGILHAEVPGLAQLITEDNLAYDVDGETNAVDLAPFSHQHVRITGRWSDQEGASVFIATAVEAATGPELADHQVVDVMPTLEEEAALIAQADADGIGHRPGAPSPDNRLEQADQAAANSHLVGSWGAVQNWPVIPVFATLLYDGRVMAYDSVSDRPTEDEPNQTFTRATVWNPTNNNFTNVRVNTGYNIFCSGFASMVDGTVFVAGGNRDTDLNGLVQTHTFTPSANGWTRTANMAFERWYPSVTPLPSTEMLITGGEPAVPEVRQTNGQIRQLTSAAQNFWANRNYPWLQTAPNGRVAFLGPSNQLGYIDTAGSGSWQSTIRRDNVFRGYGSYAMYEPGRVLIAGGATQSTGHDMRSSVVVNLDNNSISSTGNMNNRRRQHNLTLLADGSVLATGGLSSNAALVDLNNSVFDAELWNPATGQWTVMSPEDRARQYHSTALLLPDGRVLSGGGGICGDCQRDGYIQKNTQVFSPPYLFKNDGSGQLADRPVISSAPTRMGYDRTFAVNTAQAGNITKIGLVRIGSVTHGQNQEQRYVPLTFTATNGRLTIDEPANTAVAPPGHYMLFILDSGGVPSVAEMVQVIEGGSNDGGACDGLTREAEDAILTGAMQVASDGSASGGAYVHAPEGTGYSGSAGNDKAEFCFTVDTAGTYKITATTRGLDGGSDSFHVTVGTNSYLWDVPNATSYINDEVSNRAGNDPVLISLTPGENRITVHLREDGTRLDTIALEQVSTDDGGACDGLTREAEDAILTGAMQVASDGSASGGAYVHAPEGTGYSGSAGNNKADLCFNVATAGSYRIDGRVQGLSGGSDSFFVTVNGVAYLWDLATTSGFVTDSVSNRGGANPVIVNLGAGERNVTVHLREDGTRLDSMTLVRQ